MLIKSIKRTRVVERDRDIKRGRGWFVVGYKCQLASVCADLHDQLKVIGMNAWKSCEVDVV